MSTRQQIGILADHGDVWHASCSACSWQIRKRKPLDARSLLRSHWRIAHPHTTAVYLEETQ